MSTCEPDARSWSDGKIEPVDPARDRGDLRIALVHYWIVGIAGGEKVVEAILEIYPQADIFTLVHDPKVSKQVVGNRKVTASLLQRIPGAKRFYRKLLPIMPIAIENLDVRGYDLVLSSESGPAKGVLTDLDAVQVCYCHSPMRYIWDQYQDYRSTAGFFSKIMMSIFVPFLRMWDVYTSHRVTEFAANSTHVARRIKRFYGRNSTVIHPPVDIDKFHLADSIGDYYLITGRHVGYKRLDLAIEACNRLKRKLIITGEGPETKKLKALAGPTIDFVGQVSFERIKELYAGCIAFLMPGEEDFGIAPVEAMASGRPVIAFDEGGARDTVVPNLSGVLFKHQTVDNLIMAMEALEKDKDKFVPEVIRQYAQKFSGAEFRKKFTAFVDKTLESADR